MVRRIRFARRASRILLSLVLALAYGCADDPTTAPAPKLKVQHPDKPVYGDWEKARTYPDAATVKSASDVAARAEAATKPPTSNIERPANVATPTQTPLPTRDDLLPPEPVLPVYTVQEGALQVPAAGLKRLHPEYNVWLDAERKRVVLAGEICRREGALELFACLKNSKEHESIVSVYSRAFVIHAALLATGAEPGHPVKFQPAFEPAAGPRIEVSVLWSDVEGKKQEARGQDWVRYMKTKEPLAHPWVFAGSGFWVNETNGERHFLAEEGDFICVSNFPSAILDLPIEASQEAADLLFEPFTERIPPVATPVTLILTAELPVLKP